MITSNYHFVNHNRKFWKRDGINLYFAWVTGGKSKADIDKGKYNVNVELLFIAKKLRS